MSSPHSFQAAVIQMSSGINRDQNLHTCEQLLIQAKKRQAELVVLPEDFALFAQEPAQKLEIAEDLAQPGPIQQFLATQAQKHQFWIVGGTMPLHSEDGRVYASSLVFNPQGQCCARYDKMHLFDVQVADQTKRYQESDSICRGQSLTAVETPFGGLGLSVCYDLRFPEFYRQLMPDHENNLRYFTVPSAFTAVTGEAHWEILLRARAIENLAYVFAPNQCEPHENGRETWGHSLIIDPWGRILAQVERGVGVAIATINPDEQDALRERFPALSHRRL